MTKKQEFEENVNEVRRDMGEVKLKPYFFGCKTKRDDELFTIPDWGNIWQWIEKKDQEQLDKIIKMIEGEKKHSFRSYDLDKILQTIIDKLKKKQL